MKQRKAIFFSVALDGYKPGVELILRIVTGDERIVVDEVATQKEVLNWYGKGVCFDVFATAGDEKFNFEIQRDDRGAVPLRARYNSSLMDSREMQKGTDYDKLPKTAVIMICEHDVLGAGLPIYHAERVIRENPTQWLWFQKRWDTPPERRHIKHHTVKASAEG